MNPPSAMLNISFDFEGDDDDLVAETSAVLDSTLLTTNGGSVLAGAVEGASD